MIQDKIFYVSLLLAEAVIQGLIIDSFDYKPKSQTARYVVATAKLLGLLILFMRIIKIINSS
jgi:hypothetical protein